MALAFWEIVLIGLGIGFAIWLIMKWRGMDSIADSIREGGGGDGGW